MQNERYTEYLKSAEWAALRERVLERAGYRCERCGHRCRLEIHHLTYTRLYHERLDDLVALCPRCHKAAHGRLVIAGRQRQTA